MELVPITEDPSRQQDEGWRIFWRAFRVLKDTGLIQLVGHVIEADTKDAAVVHPFAMDDGTPEERAVAVAAHRAGLAMLNDWQRERLDDDMWLLPARKHMAEVQIVGLIRLRYRTKAGATARWFEGAKDWALWEKRYEAAYAEAMGIVSRVDINDTSRRPQRLVNERSTTS